MFILELSHFFVAKKYVINQSVYILRRNNLFNYKISLNFNMNNKKNKLVINDPIKLRVNI